MRTGCASVLFSSFHWVPNVSMAEGLRLAADAGFECIEYNDQSRPLFFEASDGELDELRSVAESLGLSFWSLHAPCLGRFSISSSDADVRRRSREVCERSIEVCARLGASQLVMHLLDRVGDEEAPAERQLTLALETLSILIPTALSAQVTLAIENMSGSLDCARLVEIIDGLGGQGLAICLDVGHAHAGGKSPAEEARTAGGLLSTLHVHDNDGEGDQHLPPGFGTVDFPALAQALGEVRYDGPFMLEVMKAHPSLSDLPVEDLVRLCADRVRDAMGEPESAK
ncbi:sugar phosphate isomerase/epimerase [PVC group bacterium]|nr:sugar phosphate isomerase/epimerase [PVC group bacterium]